MLRNLVVAAPCVMRADWLGWPLPQLITPKGRHQRSSQMASQLFQNSGLQDL
jgi:hypothetical protein